MNGQPTPTLRFAGATPTDGYAIAEQFRQMLDPNAERFTFLLVNETGTPHRKPIERSRTLAQIWPAIIKLNQLNDRYAVFVAVNETDFRGRKTENIVRVRALFVDADTPESVAKIKAAVAQTGLSPSFCVASKTDRMHAYWLTDDTPLDQFKPLQQALIRLFGSDKSVHDLTRVMRLPGTLHLKGEPKLVRIWASEPRRTYKTRDIVDGFGLQEAMKAQRNVIQFRARNSAAGDGDPEEAASGEYDVSDELGGGIEWNWFDKLDGGDRDVALKQMFDCRPDLALGGRDDWIMGLTAAHASGAPHAEDLAREWSRPYPGYSDDEFDKNWSSFDGKPGGITIGTLIKLAKERGFDAGAWRAYADAVQLAAQAGAPAPELPSAGSNLPRVPLVGGEKLKPTLPPQILWDTPGRRKEIMEALDARLASDPYTFRNGDRIVSLCVSPGAAVLFPYIVDRNASGPTPAVTDESDMPVILETTDADVLYLADLDHWMGYAPGRVAEGKEPKPTRKHAPVETCKLYLKLSRAKLGFRPLLGLARVPIIDDAGNLDFGEGYHEATGIFRDRTPKLNIPDNPTRADCAPALETLLKPFWEYNFEDRALGRTLILTLIFTALERPLIPTAPMFGINGAAGVGKGKLLRAVTQLAFDTRPRFITYGFNAEEFDKRIGTMFRIPACCLAIDNANGKRISNDTLESIISEGEGDIRTLGKNEFVHVVNRSLLAITGRGLEFSGDMTRRVFVLNPVATDVSPETRPFLLDPPTYVAAHRDEMLTAAFTIMRAFRRAGMPKLANTTAAGSFPEWEHRVRDLVMWLVKVDVTDQFARNREIASDKQADATLLHALHGIFSSRPFLAGKAQHIYEEIETKKHRRLYTYPKEREEEETDAEIEARAKKAGDDAVADANDKTMAPFKELMETEPKTDAEIRAEAETKVRADARARVEANARARNELKIYEALVEMCGDMPVTSKRIGGWARRVENVHMAGLVITRTFKKVENQTELCIKKT
jgi:Primase C terminal 2 (PriCT-2)/RepB DNA-primase from phage plasmid